jgi:hypothetical protein
LDLPPEIRNIIYSMFLLIPGPTYPLAGKPLSVTSRFKFKTQAARDALPVPPTALDLLRVNKQIHDEAHKIFYQNDLVFSSPLEMQDFMCSLGVERLDSLRSLTLFCKPPAESANDDERVTETGLGSTLLLMRHLKGLQKLHLLLHFRIISILNGITTKNFIDPVDVSYLKDAKTLFTVRGVADIVVRDLDLDGTEKRCNEILAEPPGRNHSNYLRAQKCIARQKAALRHINHGLQLAQRGVIVRALYTEEDWREKETWPVLEGSDCGFDKSCSCGKSGVEEQAAVETSHSSD